MITINDTIFSAVVKTALAKVAGDARWANAINRAADEIRTNPYIERGDHCLIIASPTSGNVYQANGACQCEAHRNGKPCWHRSAYRLIQRYDEALSAPPKVESPSKSVEYIRAIKEMEELFA
jgi:hypothetical protein